MSRKGCIPWNKGNRIRVSLLCKVCLKEYFVKKSKVIVSKYCSRKCLWASWKNRDWKGPNRSGSNHPRWVFDRSKLKIGREQSYDTKYKYWMIEVKKRDKWLCRIADINCHGRLEAHHILGWRSHPELRYQINNGITLCQAHHPLKRSEEAKLSAYCQKLVAEKK